jgi:NAD(P)-dependent dehydrogenase (short-subunit alcohol dehydrogenase family)
LAADGHSVVVSDLASKKDELAVVLQEIRKIHRSHPQAASLSALQLECDVTVEGQVNSLVDTTVRQLGKLDVVRRDA